MRRRIRCVIRILCEQRNRGVRPPALPGTDVARQRAWQLLCGCCDPTLSQRQSP
jgi:hypothetical protein